MRFTTFMMCALLLTACGKNTEEVKQATKNESKTRIQTMYDLETRKKIYREFIYAERRANIECKGEELMLKQKMKLTQQQQNTCTNLKDKYDSIVYSEYKITHDDLIDLLIEAQKNLSEFKNPLTGKLSD